MLTLSFCSFLSCNLAQKQSNNLKKVDKIISTISGPTNSFQNEADSFKSNGIDGKIIDTIFKLEEVKEKAKYIEGETKGERHLNIWFADTANLPDHKFYWIKVGEDNGTNLVTHFNFHVYPNSMRIMFLNVINNKEITLKEWRKLK